METKKPLKVTYLYCNGMYSVMWKGQAISHLSALRQFKKENPHYTLAQKATLKNTSTETGQQVVNLVRGRWVGVYK